MVGGYNTKTNSIKTCKDSDLQQIADIDLQ